MLIFLCSKIKVFILGSKSNQVKPTLYMHESQVFIDELKFLNKYDLVDVSL